MCRLGGVELGQDPRILPLTETQNDWTEPLLTGYGQLAAVSPSYTTSLNWLFTVTYAMYYNNIISS